MRKNIENLKGPQGIPSLSNSSICIKPFRIRSNAELEKIISKILKNSNFSLKNIDDNIFIVFPFETFFETFFKDFLEKKLSNSAHRC